MDGIVLVDVTVIIVIAVTIVVTYVLIAIVVVVVVVAVVVTVVVEALRVSYFGMWRHRFDLPSRAGAEVPRSSKYKEVRDFRVPVP